MAGGIIILSGPIGAGKTTVLRGLWTKLPAVAGFAAVRVFEGDQKLIGYDLIEARTGRRLPFLRRDPGPKASGPPASDERIGRFAVRPGALDAAAEILRSSPPAGLLAVDELGPAELEGRGHWPALRALLGEPERRFLFVIRASCVSAFRDRLAPRSVRVVMIRGGGETERATGEIIRHVHSD